MSARHHHDLTESQESPEYEPDPLVIVCQGPPVCLLVDREAVKAQLAGCPWCKRIICHVDGKETIIQPTRA